MNVDAGSSRFIDYLLFRFAKGDTSAPEDEVVLTWRRAAPENEAHFRELERLLELTAEGEPEEPVRPHPPAAELIQVAEAAVGSSRRFGLRRGRFAELRKWPLWVAGVLGAAMAGAVAVAVLVSRPVASPLGADMLGFGAQEFVTGATEAATIHLRDGTVVRLAPQSRLRLTGVPGVREVTLDGRAYFAVAKMSGRPFTVKSRGGQAVVLGTRFEVDARGEEMRLVVIEGSVALGAAGDQVRLKVGEMARSVDGAVSAPVKVEDVRPMLDWVGDFLVFQDTPVRQVATEIEQHFDVRVALVGDDLERQTVTAWFGDSSLEDVLGVVCKVLAARCSIDGANARIDLTDGSPVPEGASP